MGGGRKRFFIDRISKEPKKKHETYVWTSIKEEVGSNSEKVTAGFLKFINEESEWLYTSDAILYEDAYLVDFARGQRGGRQIIMQ